MVLLWVYCTSVFIFTSAISDTPTSDNTMATTHTHKVASASTTTPTCTPFTSNTTAFAHILGFMVSPTDM